MIKPYSKIRVLCKPHLNFIAWRPVLTELLNCQLLRVKPGERSYAKLRCSSFGSLQEGRALHFPCSCGWGWARASVDTQSKLFYNTEGALGSANLIMSGRNLICDKLRLVKANMTKWLNSFLEWPYFNSLLPCLWTLPECCWLQRCLCIQLGPQPNLKIHPTYKCQSSKSNHPGPLWGQTKGWKGRHMAIKLSVWASFQALLIQRPHDLTEGCSPNTNPITSP